MVFQFEHIMLDQEEGKEKWDTIPLNMVKLKKMPCEVAEYFISDRMEQPVYE